MRSSLFYLEWLPRNQSAEIPRHRYGTQSVQEAHGGQMPLGRATVTEPEAQASRLASDFRPAASGKRHRHLAPHACDLGLRMSRRQGPSPLATLLGTLLEWSRGVSGWIQRTASLPVNRIRDRGYRKCPKCGEPKFRMSDRQRAQPDVYGSRSFRVKWLCLHCSYETRENIEEPN